SESIFSFHPPSSVRIALNIFVQGAVFVAPGAVFRVNRLHRLDESGLVDVVIDVNAVLLRLGDGLGHHLGVQALKVVVGFLQAFHQGLLLFGGQCVPGLGADDVNIGGI